MTRRKSIYLAGYAHTNPIPVASMIGSHLVSGAITGRDMETGDMPNTLDEQCTRIFDRVRELMSEVQGSTDDIIKMTFWLVDYRDRQALNREWLLMFPDPDSRPARQVIAAQLDDALIHCDLVAVLPTEAS